MSVLIFLLIGTLIGSLCGSALAGLVATFAVLAGVVWIGAESWRG